MIIVLWSSSDHYLFINIVVNQLEAKRSAAEGKISAEKSAKEAAEGLHTQLVDEKVHGDDGGGDGHEVWPCDAGGDDLDSVD